MSPLRRTGSQLGCSQLPGDRRIFPLVSEIVDGQVKLLCCRIVAGKVPSILEHFAYLHMQALDSVGRVNSSIFHAATGMKRARAAGSTLDK